MNSPSDESESAAKSVAPFKVDLSQEDFDREFFGRILQHGDGNTDVVKRQAELLARHGNYEEARQLDQMLTERCPDDPVVHYNLACSLSMSGKLHSAVTALARAIELGYCDVAHLLTDPDLDPLRDLPSFNELIRRK
jgi:predicted Zn-dependent protease